MDAPLSGAAIAKRLASCNKTARDRAVRALSSWLGCQADDAISDADLIKIWKGLFYCVWHADKLPVQAELAGRLAAVLDSLPAPLAARYFEAFLVTIRREWGGIDFLRLDKFYLLIRKFLRHVFLLLKKNAWGPDLTVRMIGILSEKSVLATDKYPANGVNYHVAESFLDELRDFLPLATETLDLMISPFFLVLEKSLDKVLVNKIKANVFDRLLDNGRKLLNLEKTGGQVESGSDVERFGKIPLSLEFSKKLFNSASASETLQGNRKILFDLHESFLKLENDLQKSGIVISSQTLENGHSENMSCVLASESTEQVEGMRVCSDNGSDDKQVKKKKKKRNEATDDMKTKKKKKSKSGKKKSLDLVLENNFVESTGEVRDVSSDASLDTNVMITNELFSFDECLISNLQRQFEKVAAEEGMANDSDQFSVFPSTPLADDGSNNIGVRDNVLSGKLTDDGNTVNGDCSVGQNGEKSVKKVRFSMKSNLIWKPNNPLPPQSLRLPPSATPKGSALKKGVPAGPIRETPPMIKMIKAKSSSIKKRKKGMKNPSAIKRLRKLQSFSV